MNCFWEKAYNFTVGFFFFVISLCLLVLGSSRWPVIGILLAIPTLWMAFRFYSRAPSEKHRLKKGWTRR